MTELYIYHHLGLGDHIICNAIVRTCSKLADRIQLFVKPQNEISVRFMYRDLKNIDFILGDDKFANDYIIKNEIENVLKIGFEQLDIRNQKFDQSFYNQVGIDFSKRWIDFYVERDIERELVLFKKYNLTKNTEYIFLHDDIDRNYKIDENYISKRMVIIRPIRSYTDNIFDYCYLLENAKELHFMDSSFKLLFDSLEDKEQKSFHHTYCKNTIENLYNYISSSKKEYVYYQKINKKHESGSN